MKEVTNPRSDWLKPPAEEVSLARYIETIRERIWQIVIIVAITTGFAILYVATAPKVYEAETDLMITPLSSDNSALASLGLIQASADPNRDVETAARLITNLDVAERVVRQLDLEESPHELLDRIAAKPVAQSSLVAIVAKASDPDEAKELADTFAAQAVSYRTDLMRNLIDEQLPRLEAEAGRTADNTVAQAQIQAQIAEMQILRTSSDPTMRVESPAARPTAPASPRPAISIAAGIFAGIVLGIGSAFLTHALDPRLRRESQLQRRYSLPILGRIPKEPKAAGVENPLDPRLISPATAEAYRTLRTTLVGTNPRTEKGAKVIFVTGSAPSEGKTTTTLSLATSLAVSGRRVILIESDLRRPVIGSALGIQPKNGGVVSVLLENSTLSESLTQIDTYGSSLKLLLADYEGGWITELFSIPTAADVLNEARRIADVVIIDSPPLNEVVDALPLAQHADSVLIVARLGVTRLDRLSRLGELLAENNITPAGFAVVGTPRPKRSEYHYYAGAPGMSGRRQRKQSGSGRGSRLKKSPPPAKPKAEEPKADASPRPAGNTESLPPPRP